MLVPKLRFKREDGTDYPEWKSMPLGERFTFKNGINASREAFRAEGIHCIGVSDVYKCLPITAENVIGTVAISDDEIEKNKVNYGDILFQRSSETKEDIGHASVYFDNTISVYNGFVICAKPDELFYSPLYLHYSLQHSRVRKQTITLGAGSGQHYNIGQEGLAQINAVFPCLEEQQKIADFLSPVDEVIAQSEAEVQSLEQQKKAAMQKIFSQEVRFRCDDGNEYNDWEENSLKEICSFMRSGGTPKSTNKEYYNGNIPFLSISDMTKSGKYISETDKHISEEGLNNSTAWLVPKESIILSMYASYGKVCINNIELTTSQAMISLIIKDDACLEYVYQFLLHLDNIKYWKTFIKTGTQANITAEIVKNVVVFIPCLEEQQKIADFLSAYDEAICYAKQELDKWKELKKGLLQQMFV